MTRKVASQNLDTHPLQRARRLKGWKLQRLAAVCGCSVATCSRTLAGKSQDHETVAKIAEALDVPMSEVVVSA